MEVTVDKYSLMVDGKRVFIKSGAFHYFRTPGVEMARDRFLKMKAVPLIGTAFSLGLYRQ